MSIYILLHLVTFDLILLALIMILHLGYMQTMKEGMYCVLTLYNIYRKMPLSRVLMSVYILLHLVTFDLIY